MKPQTPAKLIVAIDGPSSSGKSTFAKAIARELGYLYIDSGAMYRAVTLYALEEGFIQEGKLDEKALTRALPGIHIEFRKKEGATAQDTYLNHRNVEKYIRGMEVSGMVSPVSRLRKVREKLVQIQRTIGKEKGIVMDGRDIGTVVFPDADIKIFLTSSPETRSMRRYLEMKEKNNPVDLEEIKKNLTERDRIDQSRETSPLKQAADAILLDNSQMNLEEQMEWFRKVLSNIQYESGS